MVYFENGIFISKFGYDQRMIPKAAGFRWDGKQKRWWTDDHRMAENIDDKYLEPSALQAIEAAKAATHEALQLSKATEADIRIPAPAGLDYYPYQKAGIQFASSRPGTLIADEMGLGKTIQAIGLINLDPSIQRVLVVCPASLKLNWRNELQTWLINTELLIYVLSSQHKQRMDVPGIYVINYASLWRLKWLDQPWDLLVADECHYVKNHKTMRSKSFYSIAKKAKKKVYLTGTPILNRPVEIYHPIKSLGWSQSWSSFVNRYCGAFYDGYGYNVKGATNLEELQERLRSTVMIRRLKKDVLTDLPDKIHQVIRLDPDKYQRELSNEQRVKAKADKERAQLHKAKEEAKKAGNKELFNDIIKSLKEFEFGTIAELSRARHETALAKVPEVCEIIGEALESGQAPLVFAHHRDVIDQIEQSFPAHKVVKVMGGMSGEAKQKAVEDFQNGKADLFLGSITAAGVGLTLTRSSMVIFAEQDWRPGMMQQAEDRAHRIGQKSSVLVQVVVVDGSIDSKMAKTLMSKEKIAQRALD